MISARLVELIENHAPRLTEDVVNDLVSNAETTGFRAVPHIELEARIFEICHHLGDWIAVGADQAVQAEFEEWGSRRFGQGIPLSQVVYAVILLKRHLRRYIRDHGLVDSSFPRVEGDYVLPMHLISLQELDGMVSEFFDKAVHHLARGYESAAGRAG
ncbi:MAG: hypothetical protein IT177_20780 [Acidobacteria bacterium]|nr:hypothetical protein [Acidobacteriota bacterium]